MADSKLADLTEDTSPAGADLIYKVDSTGSSGSDRKVQVSTLAGQTDMVLASQVFS